MDNVGKANIKEATGNKVYGLLYEIDISGLDLLRYYENGYDRKEYSVKELSGDVVCNAHIYVYSHEKKELAPSLEYAERIIQAMIKEGFPEEYISNLDRHITELK